MEMLINGSWKRKSTELLNAARIFLGVVGNKHVCIQATLAMFTVVSEAVWGVHKELKKQLGHSVW